MKTQKAKCLMRTFSHVGARLIIFLIGSFLFNACISRPFSEYRVGADGLIRYFDTKQRRVKILAAPDAPFFITAQPLLYRSGTSGPIIDPAIIAAARASDEGRPENLDPQGHWGSAEAGFRLSLRFSKPRFRMGEAINAIVIMRSVSSQVSTYPDGPLYRPAFRVLDDSGAEVQPIEKPRVHKEIKPTFQERLKSLPYVVHTGVFPGMQAREEVDLQKVYSLKSPGRYRAIVTRIAVPWHAAIPEVEVRSGEATFDLSKAE